MKTLRIIKTSLILCALVVGVCDLPAQDLKVTANRGIHVIASDSIQILIHNGSFINHGSFYPAKSKVVFLGDNESGITYVAGSSNTSFYGLTINKPANNFQLRTDIMVTGPLHMVQGNLELNSHTVDLHTSGFIVDEHDGSAITGDNGGQIKITTKLNSPTAFNPGNIGMEITSSANYGETIIIRGHERQVNDGSGGIHRYFEMQPTYSTNSPMQVKFLYRVAELNGLNEYRLALFYKSNNVNDWRDIGKDKSDLQSHWIMKSNLDPSGRFTIDVPFSEEGNYIKAGASVSPNPTTRSVRVSIMSAKETDATIRLLDMHGNLLEVRDRHLVRGMNYIFWNLDKYPVGSYLLSFGKLQSENLKIVKQ